MSESFRAACIQLNAQSDIADNVERAMDGIKAAHIAGADFIALPENAVMMGSRSRDILGLSMYESDHFGLLQFQNLASEISVWLLLGSLGIKAEDGRVYNRSYLVNPKGKIKARYDKIHMFDANLPNGESYRESKNFKPGHSSVVAQTPWGLLGLTICYDLRFPSLYRILAQAGASFISVPAAFTRTTGNAHWHILLRSRAIETGCFIIAPAQCGTHSGERETYGHSLIVSPWGDILADGGDKPGFIIADIDLAQVDNARKMIPSLNHGRQISQPGF